MAIAAMPKRVSKAAQENQADEFIRGANKAAAPPPALGGARDRQTRTPVVIRFDPDLLIRIDEAAARKGISRSSYVASTIADVLNGER